jgi:hypothetical protein
LCGELSYWAELGGYLLTSGSSGFCGSLIDPATVWFAKRFFEGQLDGTAT